MDVTPLIMSCLKLTLPLDLYAEILMSAILRSKREHNRHFCIVCVFCVTVLISLCFDNDSNKD